MNKEVFNRLIKNPANVSPKHKDNLKKLVDTFPYATNIRLLYLSSLLNDTDVIFEQELKKTAAYIADRSVLKTIISKTIPKESYIIKGPIRMDLVPEKTKDSESIISKSDKEKMLNQKKVGDQKTIKDPSEDIAKTKANENLSKKASVIKQESNTNKKDELTTELDNLIINSAIDSSLSIDIDNISSEIEDEKIKENNSPKSFLEWIKGSEVKPQDSSKQKERIEFRQRAELLIDQFIQNQPKIKPKAEFYSAENMARKSIEDSAEIVTETLAKIYSKQGNIAKAKSIYKQLILKNPEKKSYFASLIKDLRSE